MAVVYANLDVLIVGVFCAGGVFAYAKEALRLHRLMSGGTIAFARILKLEMDSSGSESVTHYLVTYEFVDEEGKTQLHEQDLNNKAFFNSLAVGEKIEVLYGAGRLGTSYPVKQIRSDWKLSMYITFAILAFWAAMTAYFVMG
jgi:hypothetical protein